MPHFHLSLQAGDDMVLKRMKRRHSRAEAVAICDKLRRLRPDIVFGADIIAGFPTETEEMFQRSMDLIDDCGLSLFMSSPTASAATTPPRGCRKWTKRCAKNAQRGLRAKADAALASRFVLEQGSKPVDLDGTQRSRTYRTLPARQTGRP